MPQKIIRGSQEAGNQTVEVHPAEERAEVATLARNIFCKGGGKELLKKTEEQKGVAGKKRAEERRLQGTYNVGYRPDNVLISGEIQESRKTGSDSKEKLRLG